MKLTVPYFKGEVPRSSARLLPDGYSASNTNGRILSGDLTAWKEPSTHAQSPLSPTSLNALYRMQTLNGGNDLFLRSQNDVNWARGIIAGDTDETILFTGFPDNPGSGGTISAGTAQPKITNFSLATGSAHSGQTAGNYPNDWRLLGSPAPTVAAGATSTPSSTTTVFADGTSLTGWTSVGTVTANVSHSKLDSTTISITSGSHTSKDHLVGSNNLDTIEFNFAIGTINFNNVSDTTNLSTAYFKFGNNSSGNGPVITVNSNYTNTVTYPGDPPTVEEVSGSLSFGTSSTFTGTITNTFTTGIDLYTNTAYNCSISVSLANTIYSARVIITDIASNILVVDTTQTFTPSGTYSDYRAANAYTLYIDEINTGTSTTINHDLDQTTSYIYTYVNQFGHESAPSPASGTITINPGNTTIVTTTDPPSPQNTNYGQTATGSGTKYIYRATTASTGETQYLFVAALPYGTLNYQDTKTDAQLGEAIETTNWGTPPSTGFNVLSLPNGITFLASKNNIYPSVSNHPHAYPLDYVLTTDFPIVAMSHIDNTLIVLTEAWPYIVVGSDPANLSMAKIELPYGCISKRSVTNLSGFGVIYASGSGLVAINGVSAPNLITDSFFTREQWQALTPANIIGFTHNDKYFFYSGSTGYIYDPKETGIGLTKVDISVSTNATYLNNITASYTDPITDKLYLIHSGQKLAIWNNHANSLQYDWYSKLLLSPYPTELMYAQLRGPGVTSTVVNFYVDGVSVYSPTRTSQGEFVVALPTSAGKEFQMRLTGKDTIEFAEWANDIEELE